LYFLPILYNIFLCATNRYSCGAEISTIQGNNQTKPCFLILFNACSLLYGIIRVAILRPFLFYAIWSRQKGTLCTHDFIIILSISMYRLFNYVQQFFILCKYLYQKNVHCMFNVHQKTCLYSLIHWLYLSPS